MSMVMLITTLVVGGLMISGLAWALGIHPLLVMCGGAIGLAAWIIYDKIIYKL